MRLSFEYPLYFLLFAILVAAGLTVLLYRKDKSFDELQKWKIYLISALRFIFIFLIAALLLNPMLRQLSIIESKPIIAFVQDNSASILFNRDSAYYKYEYLSEIRKIKEELSENYDVKMLRFSDKTELDSLIDFSGEITNISSVFREILTRYSGMNIGAVILATDGIYNQGMNPVYSRHIRYPVYSIALGDTVRQKDVIISDVLHNQVAFLGNKFPVRIYLTAEKCENESTELIISKNDNVIYSKNIQLPETGSLKTIDLDLPTEELGLQQYEVFIKPVENEISIENNYAYFVVDVIDKRQKILLLADAPHPDIGAFRFALKDNPNFELSIDYIKNFNRNVSDHDIVILHQLPSKTHTISNIITELQNSKIPVLYILGYNSAVNVFNSINTGIQISSQTLSLTDAQASVNQDFVQFETGDNIKTFSENSPPLRVYFGDYSTTEDLNVLMYQVINNIVTERPLIAFIDNFEFRTGFILGEGIWKWRITDFRHFATHNNFRELVNKIIRYISVIKPDDRLITDYKRIYNENEAVIINAEVYNDAFELVPGQTVRLRLYDENNKEFSYFFREYGNAYRLDLGKLLPGQYSFQASVNFDNKDYFSDGDFIVRKINIESLNITANHNVLYRLANNTGGKVFFPSNMHELPEFIHADKNIRTIAHLQERNLNISDLKILFFIILAFAGTEWFLRKFWGSY